MKGVKMAIIQILSLPPRFCFFLLFFLYHLFVKKRGEGKFSVDNEETIYRKTEPNACHYVTILERYFLLPAL